MRIALAVGVGAGIGGVVRMGLNLAVTGWTGGQFPWGVLMINILGSTLIGYLAVTIGEDGKKPLAEVWRQFAMTGFCGGFTTFSFFSLETLMLLESGRAMAAVSYSVLTLVLSIIGVVFGYWVGHRRMLGS